MIPDSGRPDQPGALDVQPGTGRAPGASRALRLATAAVTVTIALTLVVAAALIGQTSATVHRLVAADVVRIDVGGPGSSRVVPPGFIGLSIEYPSAPAYFGSNPSGLNPTFIRLVRLLDPAGSPLIRFGGDTTDWTWWPTPGVARPAGVRYTLTGRWLEVVRAMAASLGAHLVFGINLEADSRLVAAAEARAFLTVMGRRRIAGLELGNEPEVYGTLGWYRTRRRGGVPGRPASYDFPAYLRDYAAISRALPRAVPLAGPAFGADSWIARLERYLASNPRVRLITFHRYPLRRCGTNRHSPTYPTIPNLLATVTASAPAVSLGRAVEAAHARGFALRVDELNSASCGGVRGVSNTFASALWVLDTLFHMARVGVDGVNIHTFKRAVYAPFTFVQTDGSWQARVNPLYYGLLMFTRAAPVGSRLVPTSPVSVRSLRVWATRDLAGTDRIVVINESPSRSVTVSVRAPVASELGTMERLRAPGLEARDGVTIGGQSFGPETATARLTGPVARTTVAAVRHRFVFALPPASAALLSVRAAGR